MADFSSLERVKIRIRMCLTDPRDGFISRLEYMRWPIKDVRYCGGELQHFVGYGDGEYFDVVLREPNGDDILLHQAWTELDALWMKQMMECAP